MIRGAITVLLTAFLVFSLFSVVLAEEDSRLGLRDIQKIEPTTRDKIKADIKQAVEEAVQERKEQLDELREERQDTIEKIRKRGGKRAYQYKLNRLESKIEVLVEEEIITDEKGEEVVQRWVSHQEQKVRTRLQLRQSEDEGNLGVELSDGQEQDIRILPDKASDIARNRLRAQRFDLELAEEEHRNVPRAVYLMKTEKNGRFLGVVNTKVRMSGKIDPETGEVIDFTKPWWSFMVTGENDEQEGEEVLE